MPCSAASLSGDCEGSWSHHESHHWGKHEPTLTHRCVRVGSSSSWQLDWKDPRIPVTHPPLPFHFFPPLSPPLSFFPSSLLLSHFSRPSLPSPPSSPPGRRPGDSDQDAGPGTGGGSSPSPPSHSSLHLQSRQPSPHTQVRISLPTIVYYCSYTLCLHARLCVSSAYLYIVVYPCSFLYILVYYSTLLFIQCIHN